MCYRYGMPREYTSDEIVAKALAWVGHEDQYRQLFTADEMLLLAAATFEVPT